MVKFSFHLLYLVGLEFSVHVFLSVYVSRFPARFFITSLDAFRTATLKSFFFFCKIQHLGSLGISFHELSFSEYGLYSPSYFSVYVSGNFC